MDARDRLIDLLAAVGGTVWAAALVDEILGDLRTQVLREAADAAQTLDNDPSNDPYLWGYGGSEIVKMLRSMADNG